MKSASTGSQEVSRLLRSIPCERCRAEAGFTLVEVLVALAVLAVALTSIGSLMATTVRGTRSIDAHVTLVETARTIMTGLPDRGQLAIGNFSGEIAEHRWRTDVLPFVSPNVDQRLATPWTPQRVVVRVQSPGGAILQIETIRLRKRGG
jgi:general secretion pathway protein I